MKIDRSNLMQHKKLTATSTERARMLCAQAKEREEAGEFEEARLALSEFWQRIGERPRLEGLAESDQAELLCEQALYPAGLEVRVRFPERRKPLRTSFLRAPQSLKD